MKLVTRRSWAAKPPTANYTRLAATAGVKVHYTGGYVPPGIVDDHNICIRLVQQVQAMHMAGGRGEKYIDIGYSLVGCVHRRVFMGRGPHALPAANGPGLNSGHYAVLGLVGATGFTVPNDGLLHAILDAVEYLRTYGNAGKEIKGHRNGYATDCPGEPLYGWVKKGAPRPEAAADLDPEELPTLTPGDNNSYVITLRKLMHAANQTSAYWDPTDIDLTSLVVGFKIAHKFGDDPTWTTACWKAALA